MDQISRVRKLEEMERVEFSVRRFPAGRPANAARPGPPARERVKACQRDGNECQCLNSIHGYWCWGWTLENLQWAEGNAREKTPGTNLIYSPLNFMGTTCRHAQSKTGKWGDRKGGLVKYLVPWASKRVISMNGT